MSGPSEAASGRAASGPATWLFEGADGPADTSECERVFSLMNDLKSAERNKLGNTNLRNLMFWHALGKDLKCEQVPVMSILKEFRDMTGERGRYSHISQVILQCMTTTAQLASKQRSAAI